MGLEALKPNEKNRQQYKMGRNEHKNGFGSQKCGKAVTTAKCGILLHNGLFVSNLQIVLLIFHCCSDLFMWMGKMPVKQHLHQHSHIVLSTRAHLPLSLAWINLCTIRRNHGEIEHSGDSSGREKAWTCLISHGTYIAVQGSTSSIGRYIVTK